jgi:inositol-pentakisphosphate 2-kinase
MADVVHTQPKDWKYVSEGGATIVFSYIGPPNPVFDGTVLRLRKRKVSLDDQSLEVVLGDEPDDPSIEYQTKVISRLIPSQHLPVLQTVHLEKRWLQDFAQFHAASRPEDRTRLDIIDLSRKKGVLATDLVGGNWLAVEIKVCAMYGPHHYFSI